MPRQPLVRFNNGKYIDQRQQDSVSGTLAPIQDSQIVFGNLVTVDVVSGDNFIQHNLNRPYVLWIIAGNNANGVDPIEIEDNDNKSRILILNCQATAKLKLWIA